MPRGLCLTEKGKPWPGRGRTVKRVFENRGITYNIQRKYQLHIDGEGIRYQSANGKKSLDIKFAELGSIFLLTYCSSNQDYLVTFRDSEGKDIGEIHTDVLADDGCHNVRETKSLLIAHAESKLPRSFPDNLDSLNMKIAFSLAEKEISIKDGILIGAKHQVKLSEIRRVKCGTNGTLSYLTVHTKDKGGFLDLPDMKVPVNELTLPILEAVLARNTGKVIDFSRGNGFDQKTCEFVLIRYMNSTFFENEDGSVTDDWHRTAYDHIHSYHADIVIPEDGLEL